MKKKQRKKYKIINVVPELSEEERKRREEETVRVFYKVHAQCMKRLAESKQKSESKVV